MNETLSNKNKNHVSEFDHNHNNHFTLQRDILVELLLSPFLRHSYTGCCNFVTIARTWQSQIQLQVRDQEQGLDVMGVSTAYTFTISKNLLTKFE
jgi:hypothetical protein